MTIKTITGQRRYCRMTTERSSNQLERIAIRAAASALSATLKPSRTHIAGTAYLGSGDPLTRALAQLVVRPILPGSAARQDRRRTAGRDRYRRDSRCSVAVAEPAARRHPDAVPERSWRRGEHPERPRAVQRTGRLRQPVGRTGAYHCAAAGNPGRRAVCINASRNRFRTERGRQHLVGVLPRPRPATASPRVITSGSSGKSTHKGPRPMRFTTSNAPGRWLRSRSRSRW